MPGNFRKLVKLMEKVLQCMKCNVLMKENKRLTNLCKEPYKER